MGRVPVTVALDALTKDDMVRILLEPKNSIVKQYKKMFELDGVKLSFEKEAIEAIAEQTVKRKTGARGLRAIMEGIMLETMYENPVGRQHYELYDYKGSRRRNGKACDDEQ